MATINFPTNWKESSTSNTRVSHCFEVNDNDDKISKILLTITQLRKYNRNNVLSGLACNLSYQIEEEKDNMVESNVKLQHTRGKYGSGVYFMATAKNYDNQKDDYPFMLRFCYVSNIYIFEITVLCQNKSSDAIQQVFEWIKEQK